MGDQEAYILLEEHIARVTRLYKPVPDIGEDPEEIQSLRWLIGYAKSSHFLGRYRQGEFEQELANKCADTIRVRIAVAVDAAGGWNSCGWGILGKNADDRQLVDSALESIGSDPLIRFIEADVPKHELPPVVKGRVVEEVE